MSSICQRTLSAIESIEGQEIPQNMLENDQTELSGAKKSPTQFDDYFGEELSFQTTLSIAEQLFRHRTMPDTLGAILAGQFGKSLSLMMISSLGKRKRRAKNESSHEDTTKRTSFRNVRNMWEEQETVHETALCILHGSVDKIGLYVPHSVTCKYEVKQRGHFVAERDWYTFRALETMSNQSVTFAANMNKRELKLLETVVSHNVENAENPNLWQFCMFTTRVSDHVRDFLDDENVIVIRRVMASLRAGLDSCIIGAFAAAAWRFIILEFGHDSELPKHLTEHRQEKFGRFNPDMIPIEDYDELLLGSTPLQRLMIQIATTEPTADGPDAVHDLMRFRMSKPPSRRTFFRQWSPLVERAKLIAQGITPAPDHKPVPEEIRNTVRNKDRYNDLYYKEPIAESSPIVTEPIAVPTAIPAGATWAQQLANGHWVFGNKNGVLD